jgi:hypothetical protein
MIQWLNQQLNEAQLGSMGASSRYSFRPSGLSLGLPSSTPAATATAATTARTTAPVPTTAPTTAGPVTYRKPTAVTPPVVPAV